MAGRLAIPTADGDEAAYRSIAARVVWSQVIWTAGYSLTSGPILSYFGQDRGARGLITALLLIMPETAGVLALFTHRFVRRFSGRKRVWIFFSLLARALSVGIPLSALPALCPRGLNPLWLMVGSLALAQAAQAIAYVAYLAWLSDAVPSRRWGRFFAIRNIGELTVLLIVPVVSGAIRDWWKHRGDPELLVAVYIIGFFIGTLLLLASMIPLLSIPESSPAPKVAAIEARRPWAGGLRTLFLDRSLRYLLIHSWWLAVANGLTQAVFFRYLFGPLHLELAWVYVLNDCRLALGIPISWASGVIADRRGNKWLMFIAVLVAGSSMWFWLLASGTQWWWLFGAYACWGAFQAVNITGRNLLLKLAPADDKATPLALFEQVAGFLAGLSGLAGGVWLDRMTSTGFMFNLGGIAWDGYRVIFATSLVGRLTAALWLLPIHEPPTSAAESG